jgi:ATP-dependent 26S proteasome regulatory subunit
MLELLNQLDGFDERGDVKVSQRKTKSHRKKVLFMNEIG